MLAQDKFAPHWEITAWWLASRLLVFAGVLAVAAVDWPTTPDHYGIRLLTTWDGNWYRLIAENGYQPALGQSTMAFFPLLPLAMAAGIRVGVHPFLSALVLVEAAFLVGLWSLYAFTRNWLGDAGARRAAIYASIFPMSFVFSMAYPESLAFAGLVLAATAALRKHWLACAGFAALATLARPQSVVIAVPLAALAWTHARRERPAARLRAATAALAPVLALAVHSIHLGVEVGDPLAWLHAQDAWGRHFGLDAPKRALGQVVYAPYSEVLTYPHAALWILRDVVFTLLYLVLLGAAARARLPSPWLFYGVLVLALPLASGLFTSMARFGLLAFPAFVGLAYLTRRAAVDIAVRTTSLVLLAAFVVSLAYQPP